VAAQELSEKDLLSRFSEENQRAKALGARIEVVRAEMNVRSVIPSPSVFYGREDTAASKEDYLWLEQQVPVSGRLGMLRRAGDAAVDAQREQAGHGLHQLRSELRLAFAELLLAQQREAALRESLADLQELVRVLSEREREGEGSSFDRLRAEREQSEVDADVIFAEAITARAQVQAASFLAPGTDSSSLRVHGQFDISRPLPELTALVSRALEARGDRKAYEDQLQQLSWERRAAGRLRIPEPVVSAGMKRVQTSQLTDTGHIISVSVPLSFFGSRSRKESAVADAAALRVKTEKQVLEQQIASEVKAAYESTRLRRRLAEEYQKKVGAKNVELTQVTLVAYQEGEHRVLELMDAFRVRLNSQLRVLDLVASAKQAEIELERAVGEEVFP
jgi:outer membrane protein TolC